MEMRRAALNLARKGFRVFRIRRGTKADFVDRDWKFSATNRFADVYDNWTAEDGGPADYNIGVLCKGLVVLDVDTIGESHAIDGLFELQKKSIVLPDTFTVRSPSGGLHFYFVAEKEFSQRRIADGVDTRTSGGYVLGPGSWTKHIAGKQAEGFYETTLDREPAPLPYVVARILEGTDYGERAERGAVLSELPDAEAYRLGAQWIAANAPRAAAGSRGITAFEITARLGDLGILQPVALELIECWNQSHCDPPAFGPDWDKMAQSVANAYTYRRKAIGQDNPAEEFGAFDYSGTSLAVQTSATPTATPSAQVAKEAPPVDDSLASYGIRSSAEVAAIPRIPWLVPSMLIKGAVSLLVSPPGVGKSTYTLQAAAAIATGRSEQFDLPPVTDPGPVLVVNAEDSLDIMRARLAAMCEHDEFDIRHEEIADKIFLWSGQDQGPLKLLERKGRKAILELTRRLPELAASIRKRGIKALILDPLVDLHDAEENDNVEMQMVMAALRQLAHDTQVAILIVHHSRKPPQSSAEGYAGDQYAGRGATAVQGAVRVNLTFFNMTPKDAEKHHVPEHERHLYVRLDEGKQSYALVSPSAKWYIRRSVKLSNGDEYGVLAPAPWLNQAANAELTVTAAEILNHLAEGQTIKLKTAAAHVQRLPQFAGESVDTVASKLLKMFRHAAPTVNGQTLAFEKEGTRGGSFKIATLN
jgi:RecA-family ATPase